MVLGSLRVVSTLKLLRVRSLFLALRFVFRRRLCVHRLRLHRERRPLRRHEVPPEEVEGPDVSDRIRTVPVFGADFDA
jgi:hypothetical protein